MFGDCCHILATVPFVHSGLNRLPACQIKRETRRDFALFQECVSAAVDERHRNSRIFKEVVSSFLADASSGARAYWAVFTPFTSTGPKAGTGMSFSSTMFT